MTEQEIVTAKVIANTRRFDSWRPLPKSIRNYAVVVRLVDCNPLLDLRYETKESTLFVALKNSHLASIFSKDNISISYKIINKDGIRRSANVLQPLRQIPMEDRHDRRNVPSNHFVNQFVIIVDARLVNR